MLSAVFSVGCQYCQVTECWQDKVDAFVDNESCMDPWYHPEWDVSRIGQPDWCRSGFNRWLCPEACCKYRPMPVPQPVINSVQPVPYVPQPGTKHPFPDDPDYRLDPGPVPPLPEAPQGGFRGVEPLPVPPSLQPVSTEQSPHPEDLVREAVAPAAQVVPIFESPIEQMNYLTPAPVSPQLNLEPASVPSAVRVRTGWTGAVIKR